jgi:crossover junction endodeoxyribonuclease RuvC
MIICGIDPGLNGAVAILDDSGGVSSALDLPVHIVGTARGKRRAELDIHKIAALLRGMLIDHVFIEQVSAMPKQGVTGVFRFGYSAGVLEGIVVTLGLPLTFVRPQAWQRHHGIRGGADEARRRCLQLYPSIGEQLRRVKDCHRADAILIAAYGLATLTSQENRAA